MAQNKIRNQASVILFFFWYPAKLKGKIMYVQHEKKTHTQVKSLVLPRHLLKRVYPTYYL